MTASMGNFGDGKTYRYADTPTLASLSWSDPKMLWFENGFNAQNFKPCVVTNPAAIELIDDAVKASPHVGMMVVQSRYGDTPPASGPVFKQIHGLNRQTNDYAGIAWGNSSWLLGGWFSDTNYRTYGFTLRPEESGGNQVKGYGATNWVAVDTNANVTIYKDVSVGGYLTGNFTNIPQDSVSNLVSALAGKVSTLSGSATNLAIVVNQTDTDITDTSGNVMLRISDSGSSSQIFAGAGVSGGAGFRGSWPLCPKSPARAGP